MSSLARRSLRTTAAAAGIAALGVGIAGPALADPTIPSLTHIVPPGALPSLGENPTDLLGSGGPLSGSGPLSQAPLLTGPSIGPTNLPPTSDITSLVPLSSAPSTSDVTGVTNTFLPQLFSFQAPTVNGKKITHTQNDTTSITTADVPPLQSVNGTGLGTIPALPGADMLKKIINTDGTSVKTDDPIASPLPDPSSLSGGQNSVGGGQPSDTAASLVQQLSTRAMDPAGLTQVRNFHVGP